MDATHITWEYMLAGFVAVSLVASLAAIGISFFKDEFRERRLKKLEDETIMLRAELDQVKREGREKDKKIYDLQQYVQNLTAQLADRDRQIAELRRQIRPGTLQ